MTYAVLYAAPGGDKNDFVKVVFNGNAGLKLQDDEKSGYPCVGIKCLSGKGTYTAEANMWLGAGQAAFSGALSLSPPIPSGAPRETLVTAINCIDGKKLGVDAVCSDGPLATGFTMASEVRLTVLLGDAAVWEGSLSKGEVKVKVAAPPAGQRYRCVATNAGMMAFYTKFCDVGISPTFKIALNPVLKPGEARLVLTWGAQPKDLDIYVLAPASDPAQPSCEVNYKNKECFAKSVRVCHIYRRRNTRS